MVTPVVTGKTGADAVFKAIQHSCIVIRRFRSKFIAVVARAETAGAITSVQATLITNFIATIDDLCVALEFLADFSGILS